MVEVNMQFKVNGYNKFSNEGKLKLPKDNGKKSEAEMLDNLFSKWVEEEIKFTSSKDTLHPNLIKYFVDNNICKIKREEDNKESGPCYLENKNKEKIGISKQIYFGYQFVEKLRKYKKKKYISHLFDDEGFVTNLKLEEWVRSWNGVKNARRLDFIFDIGNGKKIVIEYLEESHLKELKEWSNYQTIRLVDIIFGHERDDIIHFAFIWDHLMDEDYLNKKVKFFCKICKDHYNIENEVRYGIEILNETINNTELSKLLFNAYRNENKPILTLDDINNLFNIKEERYDYLRNEFIENTNIDEDDELNDNQIHINVEEEEEEKTFYEEIDNEIFISNHGLCLYLDLLRKEYFKLTKDYYYKIDFVNRIGKSAYSSANKIRDLIINQKENFISGLKDI